MIKKHYTVQEVAEDLGVVAESVRRWIREKKLPAKKERTVGMKKVWLISQEDLVKFKNA